MYIILIGGGSVGASLLKLLREGNQIPVLIDISHRTCREISNEMSITTIAGDGTHFNTLRRAGITKADVLVAVTNRDQDNLVAAQMAKYYFPEIKTIARVNDPKNKKIMDMMGVDVTVSSTTIIANLIEKELLTREIATLLSFEHVDLELVEIEIKEDSEVAGRQVKNIADRLPENCVLVSLIRSNKVIFPRGNTVLQPGDTIAAMTTLKAKAKLEQLFLG